MKGSMPVGAGLSVGGGWIWKINTYKSCDIANVLHNFGLTSMLSTFNMLPMVESIFIERMLKVDQE